MAASSATATGKAQAPSSLTPSTVFWPEEFLASDLPQACVWTYGYEANLIEFLYKANNKNSVSQHGKDLSVKLMREIGNGKPLVFVAHSLGGIILKDAIRRSENIRNQTKLILFLGTPHRGSGLSGWGQIAANFFRLAGQDSNKKLLEALDLNSEVLDNIHEEFNTIAFKGTIKFHSFQEAHGITGMRGLKNKVVDDFSSKLGLPPPIETVETIGANHMRMAKYSSKEDEGYRAIAGVLKAYLGKELKASRHRLVLLWMWWMLHVRKTIHRLQSTARWSAYRGLLPLAIDTLFMVPFQRDKSFVGRKDIIAQISQHRAAAPSHTRIALVGLGGVGESQIAIEYAYQTQKTTPLTKVFWIHATSPTRFRQGYRNIADKLMIPGREDTKADVLKLVYDWLMILDNVDDDGVFFGDDPDGRPHEGSLPHKAHGEILITSRNNIAATNLVGPNGHNVKVEPLGEEDALALLRTKVPFDETSRADIQRDSSIRQPVTATWHLSFQHIQNTELKAANLLALMSMFDRQEIPRWLLQGTTRQLDFDEALAPLLSFSLMRTEVGQQSFAMHRLVQLSMRTWLKAGMKLDRWVKESIETISGTFPSGDYETWEKCKVLLPHLKEVASHPTEDREGLQTQATSTLRAEWYLLLRGEYTAAGSFCRSSLEIREKVLGREHPDTLISVSQLGSVLSRQGKYEEAEAMHRRALERREKMLGREHPDTLTSVSNVGSVLERQGKYEEAEAMHRRALEGYEKVLGREHPDTLTSVYCLAFLSVQQLCYHATFELYQRAYEGYVKVLGAKHPTTVACLNHYESARNSGGV